MCLRAIAAHLAELSETTRNSGAFPAATVKRILDRMA